LKFDLELFGVGGHAFLLKGKTRFASLERPDKKLGYDVDYLYRGDKLCETIHQQIEKALKSHPVNMSRLLKGKPMIHSAWIWGRGQLVKKDAIKHKMDVAVVTGTPLVKGLAKLKGYTIINADGVTGSLVTNYKNKIRASLEALNQFDVVYCHVKSPDLASHLKDVDLKMKVIETIDKEMIASIYESLKDCLHPTEVYVLSDLGTCSHSGEHFADVVPCLHAIAPWQRGYNTENFDENAGKSSVILDDKQWIKRFL
jgi:2,3-bisphosphoglycerate-independent phosphoglycerate mutase